MNQPAPNQTFKLHFDVDQWRTDIQTFYQATTQALDAIVSELSRSCTASDASIEPLHRPIRAVAQEHRPLEPISPAPPREVTRSDNRLAKLKAQLAARISTANPEAVQ